MSAKAEQTNYSVIKGYILIKSGLHIGGNQDSIQIGGIDNQVIKNPITNLPYIPGSSLKGKIRFLLEQYYGLVEITSKEKTNKEGEGEKEIQYFGEVSNIKTKAKNPDPNWKETNPIAELFGYMLKENTYMESHAARIIFRDCNIVGAFTKPTDMSKMTSLKDILDKYSTYFTEVKTEVAINRLTGAARSGALIIKERVPAGTVFDFEIVLRLFTPTDKDLYLPIIKKGLQLLENDALGGSGSRGSGRIKFLNLKLDGEDLNLKDAE